MSATYPEKLLQLVSDSVLEFCASTGFPQALELDPRDQTSQDGDEIFSASLGFSGPHLRGALVVISSAPLLAATNPQREFVQNFIESDHADWIGEIANQVVGAMKRRAAGYKVELLLSTPTVLCGTGLQLAKLTRDLPAVFWYEVAGHRLQVNLMATLTEGVTFEGEPEATDQAAGGDALLF